MTFGMSQNYRNYFKAYRQIRKVKVHFLVHNNCISKNIKINYKTQFLLTHTKVDKFF